MKEKDNEQTSGSADTQYHPQDSTKAIEQNETKSPELTSTVTPAVETPTLPAGLVKTAKVDEAAGFPTINPAAYQIEREVGRGGLGRVSLAFDKRLQREVAL